MRKAFVVPIVIAILCAGGVCFAQEESVKEAAQKGKISENLKKPRAQHGQKNPWYTRLGLIRGMQPTADGGIVVMVADKMIKYDKDLNKQKEVTIELPELPEPMMNSGGCSSISGCDNSSGGSTAQGQKE